MGEVRNLPDALKLMFDALSRRRRRQGYLTLLFMVLGAGAEMLGISAVFVLLTILTDPPHLTARPEWHAIEAMAGYRLEPLPVAIAAFVAIVLFSGAVRLVLAWLTSSFSINAGFDLSAAAFRKITTQPYSFYLRTSSDKILSRIEKIYITNGVILGGVQALVASFVSLLIIIFLLLLDFWVAITIGSILVGSYVAISMLARARLIRNSEVVSE